MAKTRIDARLNCIEVLMETNSGIKTDVLIKKRLLEKGNFSPRLFAFHWSEICFCSH